ncbi:hypothetical protein BGLA2_1720019 [Burkholderia gladioli]|nr:hypothetical protein BGLA2_1720019 [Burkholderia gladioli]
MRARGACSRPSRCISVRPTIRATRTRRPTRSRRPCSTSIFPARHRRPALRPPRRHRHPRRPASNPRRPDSRWREQRAAVPVAPMPRGGRKSTPCRTTPVNSRLFAISALPPHDSRRTQTPGRPGRRRLRDGKRAGRLGDRRRHRFHRELLHRRPGRDQDALPRRRVELDRHHAAPGIARHPRVRPERDRGPAGVCGRRRRDRRERRDDQGRWRGADAREDRCLGIGNLRVHRRRQQAGGHARRLPAAGRGGADGAHRDRPPPDGARRRAGAARDEGRRAVPDRQRQRDPRREGPRDQRAARAGGDHQRLARRGDGGPVRRARRRPLPARRRNRRGNDRLPLALNRDLKTSGRGAIPQNNESPAHRNPQTFCDPDKLPDGLFQACRAFFCYRMSNRNRKRDYPVRCLPDSVVIANSATYRT